MIKFEVGIGFGVGLLLFLAWRGVNVVPVVFLIALAALLMVGPTGARLGGRKVTIRPDLDSLSTFDDIGGQTAAKQELVEALDFVNRRDNAASLGIRPLKGVLLSGPPGTGRRQCSPKLLLRHTDAVFLATSGSEFIEMYAKSAPNASASCSRMPRTTAKRERRQTAVVFIDEIEVTSPGARHAPWPSRIRPNPQPVARRDGRTEEQRRDQILIIGATNRSDLLDNALLRPGRLTAWSRWECPTGTTGGPFSSFTWQTSRWTRMLTAR